MSLAEDLFLKGRVFLDIQMFTFWLIHRLWKRFGFACYRRYWKATEVREAADVDHFREGKKAIMSGYVFCPGANQSRDRATDLHATLVLRAMGAGDLGVFI